MSRKFIDDHMEVRGLRANLPGSDGSAYQPGHQFLDPADGARYVNEGVFDKPAFRRNLTNGLQLTKIFNQRPKINLNIGVASDLDFELQGTNAADANVGYAGGGGITLTTAGASNDQMLIFPHQDTSQSVWDDATFSTSDKLVFETSIKTGASIADTTIVAGLKLTSAPAIATDNDQAYVRYEPSENSGVWQFITSRSGTDTTTTTDVTVAVSTEYNIRIVIDGDRVPHLFINGVKKAGNGLAALTADVDLKATAGVQATAAAAKTITVRGFYLSKDLND